MSPQESGPGDPTQGWPGDGHDDGGSAPAGGRGTVPPAWEQPWAPPQQPQWQPRPGQYPNGDQYPNPQYPGGTYPGASYGASPYGQPRYAAPPKPGIIPLRPLMFGEVLDGSFQAIRRNGKAMLGAGVLAQSLSAILAAVLTGVLATSSGSIETWAETASSGDIASLGIGLMASFALLSILSVFMSAVLQGAMVVPVARSVLNRPTGFRRMLSLARPRIGALIRLAALLVAAALAAVMLFFVLIVLLFSNVRGTAALLVIPLMMGFGAAFLWVAIKLMVAPAAVVIEELGAFAGLRRSWELTRANWWRILGITLLVGILVAVITQVVLIPAGILPRVLSDVVSPHGGSGRDAGLAVAIGIITAVVGALVGAVGYAFQTSVMALLYMDLRMRRDGLDIALLRQLETGADPDGIPGRGIQGAGSTPYPGYGTAPGAWPYGR
ncbi:hypothetical protein ACFFGR_01210 [Arthrobacter liuii]|uniref:DUF7847 domain-containing protein n=1 Tax=Arthrobacter liuii TaxID=1476996 RepID=A0ABQ2AWV6_9MICC|nr:hypothetical protein [Arthrobacter liuii]GGH97776.1 hypothetical protein GCM10007170_28800 [Arthrobacter liuii]